MLIEGLGNEMFLKKKNYEEKKKIPCAPYQTSSHNFKKGCE
jgi:hypothetical protein